MAYGASILPVKVLDAGNHGPYSAIAKGITYAADHGARIINVSIYGNTSSYTLQSAVDYAWSKNAVVIACAGNEGNTTLQYPAACKNVIAVTNLDTNDARATSSSYGPHVALAAPGTGIWTTQMTSSYGPWSGTSFASPIVAGVGALMLSANPGLSNAEIVAGLEETADDLGTAGRDPSFGYGRVNAFRAVGFAVAANNDSTVPSGSITSPSPGSSLSGLVQVAINATDDAQVQRVELYIDDVLAGTSGNAAASFTWDTTVTEDGPYILRAVVYDAAGNVGNVGTVSVSVTNGTTPDGVAPTTRILSPKGGTTLAANAKIKVNAADNSDVAKVELYIDDRFVASSEQATTVFAVRTGKLKSGVHRLKAVAYDAAGNVGVSKIVKVIK